MCYWNARGWGTNIKRTYRIYRDFGLQLKNTAYIITSFGE